MFMRPPHITLTRLKKSITQDEVAWVAKAVAHARQDVRDEAATFAYLNEKFECFELLAPHLSPEHLSHLQHLTGEYHDLEYFKVLMNLPLQPAPRQKMVVYAAREGFFEGFCWSMAAFKNEVNGNVVLLQALKSGDEYVNAAYKIFPQCAETALRKMSDGEDMQWFSTELLTRVRSGMERLQALLTNDRLQNIIDTTTHSRGRKL